MHGRLRTVTSEGTEDMTTKTRKAGALGLALAAVAALGLTPTALQATVAPPESVPQAQAAYYMVAFQRCVDFYQWVPNGPNGQWWYRYSKCNTYSLSPVRIGTSLTGWRTSYR